jgi:hypothetical protein
MFCPDLNSSCLQLVNALTMWRCSGSCLNFTNRSSQRRSVIILAYLICFSLTTIETKSRVQCKTWRLAYSIESYESASFVRKCETWSRLLIDWGRMRSKCWEDIQLTTDTGRWFSFESSKYFKIIYNLWELNSVALIHKRIIPTEWTPLVGEVSAHFCW